MPYHINPETGRPNICRATTLCPFGGSEAHFASKDEARAQYEARMKATEVPAGKGKGGGKKPATKRKLSPKDQEMLALIRAQEASGPSARPVARTPDVGPHPAQVQAFNELLGRHRTRGLIDPVPGLLKATIQAAATRDERDQVLAEFAAYDRAVAEDLSSYRPALAYYQERFAENNLGDEPPFVNPKMGFQKHTSLAGAPEELQLAWIKKRVHRLQATAEAYWFYRNELGMGKDTSVLGRRAAKRIVSEPKLAQALLGHLRSQLGHEAFMGELYSRDQDRFADVQSAVAAGNAKALRTAYRATQYYSNFPRWRGDRREYEQVRNLLGEKHGVWQSSPMAVASRAYPALTARVGEAERMYRHIDSQWTPLSQDKLRRAFSPKLARGHEAYDRFIEAHDHAMELRSRGETIGHSKALLADFAERVETMRDAWFSLPKDL